MLTGLSLLACGGCGNSTFFLYIGEESNVDSGMQELHVECQKCQSVTVVKPTAPAMVTHWGENAQGVLHVRDNTKHTIDR